MDGESDLTRIFNDAFDAAYFAGGPHSRTTGATMGAAIEAGLTAVYNAGRQAAREEPAP
jgi:hypothetical protein